MEERVVERVVQEPDLQNAKASEGSDKELWRTYNVPNFDNK